MPVRCGCWLLVVGGMGERREGLLSVSRGGEGMVLRARVRVRRNLDGAVYVWLGLMVAGLWL